LNLPSLERLGRASPDAVHLWKFWRDLQCVPTADVFVEPEIIVDEGEMPANTGFSDAELDLEIRPSCTELRRAWDSAPARRVSVHCTVRSGERTNVLSVIDPVIYRNGDTVRIGPLTFRHGLLSRWGVTPRGVPLRPVERLRAEKGSRKPPPVRDARHLVRTDAPIAKGAEFWAGTVHSTGKSGAPMECFAEREQTRKAEDGQLRRALGSSNSVEWPVETSFTNNARPVTEGQGKPYSDLTFDLRSAPVRTISHMFKASRQILDDAPALASHINRRGTYGLQFVEEQQILTGNGTGQNVLGIVPQATAFAP
jgi:Phage capsid family